ncbi:MAG TPA: TIGR03089 family protein [Pseudonocardiaceae bacterium]|nr:TIGR03089 family protein [Pseudonocardiaceae bacterium]
MTVTDQLLRPLLRQPSRPLITHYDEAYGSRIELSVATMANWAAKTANWLREECDVEPGTDVAVLLPAHWQTAAVLLGAWWCGARVTDDPTGAAVAFVPPNTDHDGADTTAVVALDPLGRGLPTPPATGHDFTADVHSYGDDFQAEAVPGNTKAFLESTVDEVVTASRDRATSLGITPGARVLSTMVWTYPDGLLSGLLAILAADASLVQSDPIDPAKLAARRQAERTTIDLV